MTEWYDFDVSSVSWADREMVQKAVVFALGWTVIPHSSTKFLLISPSKEVVRLGELHDINRALLDEFLVTQYVDNLLGICSAMDEVLMRQCFGYEILEWRDGNYLKAQLICPNLTDLIYVELPTLHLDIARTKAYAYSVLTLKALQAYYFAHNGAPRELEKQ